MHQNPLLLHTFSRAPQFLLNDPAQLPEDIKQVLVLRIVLLDEHVRDPLLAVLLQHVLGQVFAHDREDRGNVLGGEEVQVGGGVGAEGKGGLVVGLGRPGEEDGEGDVPAKVEGREDLIDRGASQPALETSLPDQGAAVAGIGGKGCHGGKDGNGGLFKGLLVCFERGFRRGCG